MQEPPSNESNLPGTPNRSEDVGEPTWEEIRPWAEFCCWTALVMAPIINWVNGPAVSQDQFVVRTGLIVLAACGGIGLRFYALLRR